ncbi:MAG: FecR protein [Myxococcales bacterium]|nr:FecR protein [Myxococcales bacterium]
MSRHVAPHRWADAFAGKLDDSERALMDRHAESCAACQRTRTRIAGASDSYGSIRTQPGPELPWDSVRARVHWAVSKEKRAQSQPAGPPGRRVPNLVWGVLAATAAGALALVTPPSPPSRPAAPVAHVTSPVAPPAPVVAAPPPAAIAGLVIRVAGSGARDVMIDGVRPDDLFARHLGAGTVIATGEGRVDVQFGDASAFALGPRSTLELRRFDSSMIELVIDGTIDLEVAHRAAGQRLVVVAGEHTVEVRGTQFRVSREQAGTTVSCRHGLVAVRDGSAAQVEVGTARRIQLAPGAAVSSDQIVPLSVDELASLASATPIRVPLWNIDALVVGSAPLEITTVGPRDVRVDGVELGLAPLSVRVMPGRHTVESADSAGRYRRVGWVDVAVPSAGSKPARLEVPAEVPRTAGVAERRRQLREGIDQARLARCTRSIAKAGLTGTYVQVELAVDASGAVGFLNVIDTDLPSATASCVREVLADVRFRQGAPATWREKLDL